MVFIISHVERSFPRKNYGVLIYTPFIVVIIVVGCAGKLDCSGSTKRDNLSFCIFCIARSDTRMIDSGTSTHVTSMRDVFCSYTSGEFGDVKLAYKGVLKCVGLGDVNLEMSNGTKLTLKDVKHVPDI